MERRRRPAVELTRRGESPTVVARILGVGRTSLYRWPAMAQKSPEALAARPHPGPRPRLSDEQLRDLERLLPECARAHGWPNDLWSAGQVDELVRRRFGVGYHVEHVRKILRRRLGRSSQRPQRKARQRDEGRAAR